MQAPLKGLGTIMEQDFLITLISLGVTALFILGLPIFLVIDFWVTDISLVIDFTLANIGSTLFEGLSFLVYYHCRYLL